MSKSKTQIQKEGYVLVGLDELDGYRFQNMSFFEKWVPEGCELVEVGFSHDFGIYDQGDRADIAVYWQRKENKERN